MRILFERVLCKLFPPVTKIIETPEDADSFFKYAVSNHHDMDPFRPFGHWDSWAGHTEDKYKYLSIYASNEAHETHKRKRKTEGEVSLRCL
jgi:hypothetical protein